MVALRLEEDALDYATAKLEEADGGIAGELVPEAIWEPVVFVPDFIDPMALPGLDASGVASPDGAAAELASYLLFLKKRDGRLHSLIFDDPWASIGDLDYDGPPPDELLPLQGRVCHLYDIGKLSPDLILDWRDVAVSHLKLIYVSELTPAEIRALAEDEPDDLFHRLAHSVRHVALSAYDDESWLILRHERTSQPHQHCHCHDDDTDNDGNCGGDCDCDGECGEDCHCHDHDSKS